MVANASSLTKSGSSTKQLAESVDIFPTIAELAGLGKPDVTQRLDGVSLVPVLRDGSARVRDHAYHAYPKRKLGRAIRTERYRLVEWQSLNNRDAKPEYELYDYSGSVVEEINIAKQSPEIVEDLKIILARYPDPVPRPKR